MGNRFVICIENHGKMVAAAYYPLGGTTAEALKLTAQAISAYNQRIYSYPIGFDAMFQGVDMLLATGAGFDLKNCERRKGYLSTSLPGSIEKGFIYTSVEDMQRVTDAAIYYVVIDIGWEQVDFNVYDEYERSQYDFLFGPKAIKYVDSVPYTDIGDLTCLPIAYFSKLREFIDQHPAGILIDNMKENKKYIYKWC